MTSFKKNVHVEIIDPDGKILTEFDMINWIFEKGDHVRCNDMLFKVVNKTWDLDKGLLKVQICEIED